MKSIEIVFFQPISFLLYIGKRFRNLETLKVGFLGKDIGNKDSKYFDGLHKMNLTMFRKLTCFKLHCNWIYPPYPLNLNTMLTILNGCQNTLTKFELECYRFSDVKKIIDFICSKNMPLKYISFKLVHFINNKDLMKLVKLKCCGERLIIIKRCWPVTRLGIVAALVYINQNNLKIRIKYNTLYPR